MDIFVACACFLVCVLMKNEVQLWGGEKPCFIPIDEEDVIEIGASLPFAKGRWNLPLGGSGNRTTAKEAKLGAIASLLAARGCMKVLDSGGSWWKLPTNSGT